MDECTWGWPRIPCSWMFSLGGLRILSNSGTKSEKWEGKEKHLGCLQEASRRGCPRGDSEFVVVLLAMEERLDWCDRALAGRDRG
jgi:hypothetical protein